MRSRILLIVLLVLAATACAGPQGDAPDVREVKELTFMAGYKPQANLPFVGVYVAEERGYFDDVGLDVTIQHSGGGGEHLQLLTTGTVDVTTQDAGVLLQRRVDPGLPLVSIAMVGQVGQQAFVALKDSGFETPRDWEGHTVGFKGTPPPDLFALLDAAGADVDSIELINVGFDPRVLTEGLVDVYPVFKSNEPYLLQTWGYEIVQWDAAAYDVPTLGLTYVSTPETIEADPDRMQRFVTAALRGIEYAETNPDEAVEIVMEHAGPESDPDHMRFMLMAELEDTHSAGTDAHGLGWQTTEQWQALADMLQQYNIIEEPADVSEAFTTRFLDAE